MEKTKNINKNINKKSRTIRKMNWQKERKKTGGGTER